MSISAEPTTWERVLELFSDGGWHTEAELEHVTQFPEFWIRELEESGYSVQRSRSNGHPRVRVLA
jgi:hypothetical protein